MLVKRYHHKLDPDVDTIVGFIRTGVDRMETLIQGLLSYSATLHEDHPVLCATDANAVVDHAIADLQQRIADTGAVITRDTLPAVLADSIKLRGVFEHLFTNAMKFRKESARPRIHVAATIRTNDILFAVSDNGLGIDPQYSEQIFGLFKRLHRDDSSGLGMGLALCRRVVQQHGGRIWVEASPAGGATFYFTVKPATAFPHTREAVATS
jgi:light-regulated signal transduction histidine kinase (bacteriophytochrome)